MLASVLSNSIKDSMKSLTSARHGARVLRAASCCASLLLLAACGGGDIDGVALDTAGTDLTETAVTAKSSKKGAQLPGACAVPASGPAADSCDPGSAAKVGAEPGTATVSWGPTPASKVSGYRIYYGTAPGAYDQAPGAGIETGNVTSYPVKGLVQGQRYYFAVAAIDAEGRESELSEEITHVVP